MSQQFYTNLDDALSLLMVFPLFLLWAAIGIIVVTLPLLLGPVIVLMETGSKWMDRHLPP